MTLSGSARLVVFASAKNRAVAGAQLHTDFKLPAAGSYLALTKPDGTVAHSFAPYPSQTDGFSYGVNGLTRAAAVTFFNPATPVATNGLGITAALAAPVFSVKKAVFKAIRAGLRVRGQSSAGFPKQQYKLETWNEANGDKDESLLGLPPESDWVLGGQYADESLLRNPLIFGLGKELGITSPGTRYCEVFLNTNGGAISSADYAGVYLLTESLKIGKNRLDLADPNDYADHDGGYLIRHEAGPANETRITGWTYAEIHDPIPTTAQKTFISSKVNGFNAALRSANFKDPVTGYRAWADPESFARMAVMNEYVRAQDGYVRSAYFYKDRGQKLKAGPLWDFDPSFGVSCCFNTHLTGIDH